MPSSQPSRPASKAENHPTTLQAVRAAAKRRASDRLAGALPTDSIKLENAVSIQSYVTVVEDLILRLQINVAIAKGFQDLEVPLPKPSKRQNVLRVFGLGEVEEEPSKKYIDMWPIQMSAEIATAGDDPTRKNALTTNFDTYTLILQLGCILNTVPSWKRTYKLRVCVFVEYESDVDEERGRVSTLLRNLRIEAQVVVFWLASGELKTYEVIINGSQVEDCAQARADVNDALQEEEWWKDMQRLRQAGEISSSQELTHAADLLEAVTNWPTGNFQHGRPESKPKRFAQLRKLVRRKHRTSVASVLEAGFRMGMRSQRLPAHLLSDSDSSSGESENDADDEAVHTDSEPATDPDLTEYDLEASDEGQADRTATPIRRAKSMSATMGSIPYIGKRLGLRKSLFKDDQPGQKARPETGSSSSTPAQSARPTSIPASDNTAVLTPRASPSLSTSPRSSGSKPASRPPPIRQQSIPKFTSKPHPHIAPAPKETTGPSIVFVDTPEPSTGVTEDPMATYVSVEPLPGPSSTMSPPQNSSRARPSHGGDHSNIETPSQAPAATGYPLQSAIPLSFNDLPCRAQHLILNELIRQNSEETAVVFTTLPSPVEGTCESETDSVKYISDLEVLCLGLPPVLLVHSNSMTVTMNL